MSKQNRRTFLKIASTFFASTFPSQKLKAAPQRILSPDRNGVLVDTTLCIGCRECEYACKIAHDLQTEDHATFSDRNVFKSMRRPDDKNLTVVNAYAGSENQQNPITVKVQCMHCDEPACLSACIVGAFSKDASGIVSWDEDKCIGCRYCLIACPFQIPAYEYGKALEPKVMKCDWCEERQKEGKRPACVDICPVEALLFGKRSALIGIARERIRKNPDRYIDHIYGENEVGGTSWLYLAGKDFKSLAFPELSENPAPGVSESIQHGIFAYFVPPVALYAVLGGVMWITKNKTDNEGE
jgi:Fe-S-cluster-containing dehydrogenase component